MTGLKEKSITTRMAGIVQGEIQAIENLIEKRKIWLNDEKNKKRTTYFAVSRDTDEMLEKLSELKSEHQTLLFHQNK